jgi:Holliday junction resolvase RusA-like endonuclease
VTPIVIDVPGVPQQQGSKTKWGVDENEHLMSWRQSIADKGHALMHGERPLQGPVEVEVGFTFPRPKSHYRSGSLSDLLRDNAPVYHTSTPDLDKLQRAIGDALSGTVILDDRQIVCWLAMKKYGNSAGARIVVRLLARTLFEAETSTMNSRMP